MWASPLLLDFLFIFKCISVRDLVYSFGFNYHLYVEWTTVSIHWTLLVILSLPWGFSLPGFVPWEVGFHRPHSPGSLPWPLTGFRQWKEGRSVNLGNYLSSLLIAQQLLCFSSFWLALSLPWRLPLGSGSTSFPPHAPVYLEIMQLPSVSSFVTLSLSFIPSSYPHFESQQRQLLIGYQKPC